MESSKATIALAAAAFPRRLTRATRGRPLGHSGGTFQREGSLQRESTGSLSLYRPLRVSLLSLANEQRVILIVHLRLYAIPLLDLSDHLGRFICMKTDFLAVLPLDEVVSLFDAEQFARDHFGGCLCGYILSLHCICQSEAQHETAREDTDNFV